MTNIRPGFLPGCVAAAVVVLGWLVPASAFAQDPAPAAVPDADARAVFVERCGNCHGPELSDPDGDFSFGTDLRGMIGKSLHSGDMALVQIGNPDQSLVWDLIVHGDMPPEDSPQMTDAEKAIISNWIRGLATATADPQNVTDNSPAGTTPATNTPPAKPGMGPVQFAGRFHVLVLHFPVALLLAALLAELLALRKRADAALAATWLQITRFCTWTGALGAVAAAITGWAAFLSDSFVRVEYLDWHKIGGTVVAVLAIGAAVLVEWAVRNNTPRSRWILRGALALLAALLTITAHIGGIVTHGVHHVPLPF